MAKDRFVEVYSQGVVKVAKILVDQNGKPVITPIQ